jgi:hypothetical protein
MTTEATVIPASSSARTDSLSIVEMHFAVSPTGIVRSVQFPRVAMRLLALSAKARGKASSVTMT